MNPNPYAQGLHLNINELDNRLDFLLAFDAIDYFQLKRQPVTSIYDDVLYAVAQWEAVASNLRISRQEQVLMKPAVLV